MEKSLIPGLSPQDFFEIYKFLVKTELLESKPSNFGTHILENLMSFLDKDNECEFEDEDDMIFYDPNQDHCESMLVTTTPQSTVEFIDLKEVYEKVQSRAGGGSHQRVSSGEINIRAISDGQLCGMDVFVERMPEAAALCGDMNGRIPLEVNYEDYFKNQQLFSVDLDSVYNTPDGTPVYKLATVDAERRNLFNLIVFLKFIDGTESGPFMSKPFLLRSRKPGSRKDSSGMS
ncbi:uncharacterized protein LOC114529408 [Dendronephthya gigantea]|uniref:uncharacterized protein LOC114529408 n=1 Tax=Dendronephthya gigantea TaxID=151771 RepID=UPI00106D61D4|nr:uncharacterized protein LOC114529408 [Dendronephthya gigantea]